MAKENKMDLPLHVHNVLLATSPLPVLPAHSAVLLGLSGGVDSVVLLHLLHQLAAKNAWSLRALHVHHGISPQADSWAEFCAMLCKKLNVPLQIERVHIASLRAMGIEAAARKLRHAALLSQPENYIALAHHQDDQAETLLLQLLRGAGVRGAAAMPPVKNKMHGTLQKTLLRPLLDVPRSALMDYAQQHGLHWVEDESNAEETYPRNFLRHRVLPQLEKKFPVYRETLSRSARHFAEASALLDELAALDLIRQDLMGQPSSAQEGAQGATLEVSRLCELSAARGKNLLRYFLAKLGAPTPDSTQLVEMLHQLCHARRDAAVCVTFGGWQARRYKGRVYASPMKSALAENWAENFCVTWRGESVLPLPELNSTLHFDIVHGQGLSLKKLQEKSVTIRLRRGAERIRPSHANSNTQSPTRTLKNLLQEHDIPPWQRDILPLLFCGEDLVWVAGVATAAEYVTHPGEAGVLLALVSNQNDHDVGLA